MECLKQIFDGLTDFMKNVSIPFFGESFSLWSVFLFGLLGGIAVWFLRKFL